MGANSTAHWQPIHVNITNNPLVGASSANQFSLPSRRGGIKRTISYSSDEDTASESLTISDILTELHARYPKLDFPQYEGLLAEKGIVYAESAMDFDKDFYFNLGIAEGAVGSFMKGIGKALHRKKKGKKSAKVDSKGNKQNRAESIEL